MTMKITIFNGPKKEFENLLPVKSNSTLLDIVTIIDRIQNGVTEEQLNTFNNLIVYGNEYSGVNKHVIDGFIRKMEIYSKVFGFYHVYLQNPPSTIVNQLKNIGEEIEMNIIDYEYDKVTKEKLSIFKRDFDDFIFGQCDAKIDILRTIFPLTQGQENKPIVMMFYGPPGVGKTETAKYLNELLGGEKLFKKQLSMFQGGDSSYLFGGDVFSFAKDLKERETNILLLDEFDKAHPIFFRAFYEMFDEGYFEDNYYKVDLNDTIIICTSNFSDKKEIKEAVGPALYSRFNNLIEYKHLSQGAKYQILNKEYENLLKRYTEEEQQLLYDEDVFIKMKNFIDCFHNAREIKNNLSLLMASYVIKEL